MRILDGNKKGGYIFLRCSGQGGVSCRICNNYSWLSNAYARINKDNQYDYYCRDCVDALSKRSRAINLKEPENKRELEYIKKKGLELW